MSPHNHIGVLSPRLHIHLYGKRISSFHFFGGIGFILGMALGLVLCKVSGLQPPVILLMTVIGAASFITLALVAKRITGDEMLVYYHHEIAIVVCCAAALYLFRLPVLPYLDITLLGIGVFLAFGRIGCHSVGCCHGKPHHRGIRYGQQHVDAGFTWYYKDIPLLPVQLMESACVFVIVLTGAWLLCRHVQPGTVLVVYTVIYGSIRFGLEFFRGDDDRPYRWGLSEAQWTTLALVALTYGLGGAGLLPVYAWHAVIFLCMLAASVILVLLYRSKVFHPLLAATHVTQIAEGLEILEIDDPESRVSVHTTNRGLCLSSGNYDVNTRLYTLSLKNASLIKRGLVEKLARTIGSLKHHAGGFDIIDKKNGVYHILFRLK